MTVEIPDEIGVHACSFRSSGHPIVAARASATPQRLLMLAIRDCDGSSALDGTWARSSDRAQGKGALRAAGVGAAVAAGVARTSSHHAAAAAGALDGVLPRVEEGGLPRRCGLDRGRR